MLLPEVQMQGQIQDNIVGGGVAWSIIIKYRIVTALVWTNSLKCPQTEEAFIGSRAQPETQ